MKIAIFSCVLATLTIAAWAEEPLLQGTVREKDGPVMAGVIVRLATRSNGVRITQTDPKGTFLFAGLDPGAYSVSFERAGYKTLTRVMEVSFEKDNDDDDDSPREIVMTKDPPADGKRP